MKKLFFLFLVISTFLPAQVMWQIKKDTVVKWSYYDGDEFNGTKVNTNYWKYVPSAAHNIYTNQEQQYYTQGNNHIVSDGSLKLIAKKEPAMRLTVDGVGEKDSLIQNKKFYGINKKLFVYTSGQVETIKPFQYGFFECRFKLPNEKGYWPAIWLHGGDPNEEIDLVEGKGERPKDIHIDTHCPNRCDEISLFLQKRSFGGWVKTKYDFSKEFNVISCDWDENQVRFYLNGESVAISKVKFQLEKYFTLNLAIPGDNGPFKPGPDKKDSSQVTFEIDYFRVWNKAVNNKGRSFANKSSINSFLSMQKPLLAKTLFKSRKKLVYGSKKDHRKEGIFISFFNNEEFIQLNTLGVVGKQRPSFKVTNNESKIISEGMIDQQIYNINKSIFIKGEYLLEVEYIGRILQQTFSVD